LDSILYVEHQPSLKIFNGSKNGNIEGYNCEANMPNRLALKKAFDEMRHPVDVEQFCTTQPPVYLKWLFKQGPE
jgi:hypothetical protein